MDARQQSRSRVSRGSGPFRILSTTESLKPVADELFRALVESQSRAGKDGLRREKWLGLKAHFAEPSLQAVGGLVFLRWRILRRPAGGGRRAETPQRASECLRHGTRRCGQHPARGFRSTSGAARPQPELEFAHRSRKHLALDLPRVRNRSGTAFSWRGTPRALWIHSWATEFRLPCAAGHWPRIASSLFLPARPPWPKPLAGIARPIPQSLLPVFRASSKIRRMLVLPGLVRRPLLFLLQSSPALTHYLVRQTR